ncbi:MAG TPA: Sir2 family NAD-dependent protein deacetylase [Bacillota bacterium]|nr:Sir2 family NAD-dependent protein deacetylase [Bacillota bacterium]
MDDGRAQVELAARMIAGSTHCVALTGAGVSTESGLPDFRSPGTGLWEGIDPAIELSATALRRDPERFYHFFLGMRRMAGALPNRAHEVLALLEHEGLLHSVITQNIDGLHRRAGSRLVLEVHGNLESGTCLDCRRSLPMPELLEQVDDGVIPPRCRQCGEVVRPDVVLFGDQLPECFAEARAQSARADVMLVVGTSLTVWPVAGLPALARSLIIVNLEDTPYDHQAAVRIRDRAGVALAAIWDCLFGSRPTGQTGGV